jgi:hypothetical protein
MAGNQWDRGIASPASFDSDGIVQDHGAGFLSQDRPRPLGGGLLLLDGCFGCGRMVDNHREAPLVHDDHPSANDFFSSLGTALTETCMDEGASVNVFVETWEPICL